MWWSSPTAISGTAGGWNSIYSTTTTSSATIWWPQTGTSTATNAYTNWQSQTGAASTLYNAQQLMLNRLQMQQSIWQERLDRQERQAYRGIAAPAILRSRENPAAQRARELLISLLSDDQRRTYEDHGWFIVVGGRSGRRYRISGASYAGNVSLLAANDNNKVEATFCGHCDASIPLGDQLLAQKVMLEVDEPAYIALANRRAA